MKKRLLVLTHHVLVNLVVQPQLLQVFLLLEYMELAAMKQQILVINQELIYQITVGQMVLLLQLIIVQQQVMFTTNIK